MVGRIPPTLLVQIGLTITCVPSLASAQIFTRAVLEDPSPLDFSSETNVACGMSSCPPQTLTYGYFHEHWRRWPEEPPTTLPADALSPFVRPPRDLPAVRPPDMTEEESLAPPRRGLDGSAADESGAAPGTTGPAAPSATPTPAAPLPGLDGADREPERPSDATLPDDTALPFDEPAEPPSDSGFFPLPDDGEADGLPEAFPDLEPDSTTPPPADFEEPSPSQLPDTQPPEDDVDDIFNLDDFSRTGPQRMYRYRMSSSGQLRRSRTSTSPARVHPSARAASRPPIQLAGYRQVVRGRRNPLRSTSADEYAALVSAPVHSDSPAAVASGWEEEPVQADQVQPTATPLEWTSPAQSQSPRRARGRSNPLR